MFPALVEYMDSREALRRINNFTVRAVRQQARADLHDGCSRAVAGCTVLSQEGFHVFVLDGRLMWMTRGADRRVGHRDHSPVDVRSRQGAAGGAGSAMARASSGN
jgi:hypothetical protein